MKRRKNIGPTNPRLIRLISKLERSKSPMWKDVAWKLSLQRRRAEVNVSKIDRYASDGEVVVIPGKVLGNGEIKKKVTVVAFNYTKSAREKLLNAGCEVLTIDEYFEKNPEGKNVRIMG